jgi:SAM-dependent methyltransferase
MHDSVMAWVGQRVRDWGLADWKVLEVGSLDVNGSVRGLFTGEYTGIDMREGRGVDIVGMAHDLPFEANAFDCIVSTEMLEHDPAFWVSLAEMGRVLHPGGHLLLTTRGNGFGEHNEPSDYWRFMPASMPLLLDLASCDPIDIRTDPEVPGIFMHGVRR